MFSQQFWQSVAIFGIACLRNDAKWFIRRKWFNKLPVSFCIKKVLLLHNFIHLGHICDVLENGDIDQDKFTKFLLGVHTSYFFIYIKHMCVDLYSSNTSCHIHTKLSTSATLLSNDSTTLFPNYSLTFFPPLFCFASLSAGLPPFCRSLFSPLTVSRRSAAAISGYCDDWARLWTLLPPDVMHLGCDK